VIQSALGFDYNAQSVLPQLLQGVDSLKSSYFDPTTGDTLNVAAIQADVIAHSMGGVVTRTIATLQQYRNRQNFGQGSIHKLITFDTPHLGSPLAQDLLNDANACTRNFLANHGNPSILTLTMGHAVVPGGVGDLRDSPLSPALTALQGAGVQHLPTAYVAGTTNMSNLASLDCSFCTNLMPRALKFECPDTLAQSLTSTMWNNVFGGQNNDAIVPWLSQTNGGAYNWTVPGVIHSPGAADLGFSLPSVLDQAMGGPALAIYLLNQPLTALPYVH
jgi:hypothetical protein